MTQQTITQDNKGMYLVKQESVTLSYVASSGSSTYSIGKYAKNSSYVCFGWWKVSTDTIKLPIEHYKVNYPFTNSDVVCIVRFQYNEDTDSYELYLYVNPLNSAYSTNFSVNIEYNLLEVR